MTGFSIVVLIEPSSATTEQKTSSKFLCLSVKLNAFLIPNTPSMSTLMATASFALPNGHYQSTCTNTSTRSSPRTHSSDLPAVEERSRPSNLSRRLPPLLFRILPPKLKLLIHLILQMLPWPRYATLPL